VSCSLSPHEISYLIRCGHHPVDRCCFEDDQRVESNSYRMQTEAQLGCQEKEFLDVFVCDFKQTKTMPEGKGFGQSLVDFIEI
jgi:hypothetical protein